MEDNYSLSLFVLSLALSKMTLKLAINGKSAEESTARARRRTSALEIHKKECARTWKKFPARKLGPLARGEGYQHASALNSTLKVSSRNILPLFF